MPKKIHVDPDQLLISATRVDGHATEVKDTHAASHARIQDAQPGLVGSSAAAIESKLTEWQGVTRALHTVITDHAHAFRTSAAGFANTESRNAQAVAEVGAKTPNRDV
jgi:WXG100 family type VII secretion target